MIGSGVTADNMPLNERLNLALILLEKLKTEVVSVEARYPVLSGGYSDICDEVLSKLKSLRSTLSVEDIETRAVNSKAVNSLPTNIHIRAKYAKNVNGKNVSTGADTSTNFSRVL